MPGQLLTFTQGTLPGPVETVWTVWYAYIVSKTEERRRDTPMNDLAPIHTPSVIATTPRDKALADVFTTALEGGIGYWSTCTVYRWSVDGTLDGQARDFVAVIHDMEDGEATAYTIDRAAIARGIDKAYEYYKGSTTQPYILAGLTALKFGNYDDADYDATTADVIVQFGVIGELTYG